MVASQNIEKEVIWKVIRTVRFAFIKINSNIKCLDGGFIPEQEIYRNYESLEQLSKVDNNSTEVLETISKETIEYGGEMFAYLNSCPSLYERLYYKIIYGSISQSRIVTLALNIGRKANKDFSQKALRILSRITSITGYDHVQYSNESLEVYSLFNMKSVEKENQLLQMVSNHPVHILRENGEISPSSFIPFCSFGEDPVGTYVNGFDVPVCDIFRPRIRNDQLCYETNLQEMISKDINTAKKQLEIGLVLIIDYNDNRQLYPAMTKQSKSGKRFYFNYDDNNPAISYFNTISKKFYFLCTNTWFLDDVKLTGEGEYNLNILKEIEVTESFNELDEDVRECQNKETYDECTTRHYIEEARQKCGCLPFAIRLSEMVNDHPCLLACLVG